MLNYKKIILVPLLIASILLTICMAWVSYSIVQLIGFADQEDLLDLQRYRVVSLSNAMSGAEVGVKGYLMTQNVMMLNRYQENEMMINQNLSAILREDLGSAEIQANMKLASSLIAEYKLLLNTNIQVHLHAGSYASHLSLVEDKNEKLFVQVRALLQKVDKQLYQQLLAITNKVENQMKWAVISGVLTALIILLILLFAYKRTTQLFRDVIEKEHIVNDLSHQATHDPLTSLMNRRGFEAALEKVHAEAITLRKQYAVLFMDLDRFKAVNDTYGHDIGDQLLVEVANHFTKVLRGDDLLARLGGDEFALLIKQYKYEAELTHLADRLIESLSFPIMINALKINVGVSIGIATFPKTANNVEDLLTKADEAMYQSKHSGKNIFSIAKR